MIKLFLCGVFFSICTIGNCYAQTKVPAPVGPVPSANQMRWQEMEYYAFVHFSLNTYTDQSWGYGNEDINLFNPEVIVLGGGIIEQLEHEMLPIIDKVARKHALSGTANGIEIMATRLGDNAGITGGAVLASRSLPS